MPKRLPISLNENPSVSCMCRICFCLGKSDFTEFEFNYKGRTKAFILQGLIEVLGFTEKVSPGATFEDLLDAIEQVKLGGDSNAVGDYNGKIKEKGEYRAIGAYQIHKIYVDDCNRIMKLKRPTAIALIGNVLDYDDRWDRERSRMMVNLYTNFYALKVWREVSSNLKFSNETEGMMKFFELQARIHVGGPDGWKKESTKKYWLKVKKELLK